MRPGVGAGKVSGGLLLAVLAGLACCGPTKGRAVTAPAAPQEKRLSVTFKRVDRWRFVDRDLPPTPAELQLKEHFQRVFANAQFSEAYTCLAREYANFWEQQQAVPDESLEMEMAGRCGVADSGYWASREQFSDGTLLDKPISPEVLADITTNLSRDLPTFSVFGISARDVGPNAFVSLYVASPGASMHVGTPDEARNVRVEGTLFSDYRHANAVINQGESGSERCDPDPQAQIPNYAFTCSMAAGDDEAWITVSADNGGSSWEYPLVLLPARRSGWVPPKEYHRHRLSLPEQVDTAASLLAYINDLRRKLGRSELTLAREQSAAMQPIYERMFPVDVAGDWARDTEFRSEMLKGKAIRGPIWWGRAAIGIAFGGDAADWLAFRLESPIFRETLMDPLADQLGIAIHGDPAVGFGAAAITYSFFTPQREQLFADDIATRIAELRGKLPTRRVANPLELERAAREIAAGAESPKLFASVLTRLNFTSKGPQYLDGVLLDLPKGGLDFDLPPALREEDELVHGVVTTHYHYPGDDWSRLVAFVWFAAERPSPQKEARLVR